MPGMQWRGPHDHTRSYRPGNVVPEASGVYVCTAPVSPLSVPFTVPLRADTFIRGNQSGWGTASGGFVWADAGIGWANGAISIASNKGVQAGTANGDGRFMRAGDALDEGDDDLEVLLRWTLVAPSPAYQPMRLSVRSTLDTTGYSQATLWLYLNGTAELGIIGSDGSENVTGTWVGAASGTPLWTRYRAVEQDYFWRTWADGDDEPPAWDGAFTSGVTTTDRCVLVAMQGNSHGGDSLAIDSFSVSGPSTTVADDPAHWALMVQGV